MKNATLENIAQHTNFGVQIVEDLPITINGDVFMYLIMTGGFNYGNRIFSFDNNNTLGRKLFYLISMGYLQVKNIHNLNSYIEMDPIWLNNLHHTEIIPVIDENGEQTGTTEQDVLNKDFYQVIQDKYIKLTDDNLELISELTYTEKKANEIVFELPIIEEING